MIGFVRGKLFAKNPPALVIDVQGVGYELEAPMTTFYHLPPMGSELTLFTHVVIREDAHHLYGFATVEDRLLFRSLIKVNGVGPKLALTILSGQSAAEFRHCIENNDAQALVRLPGVGKKTAERLIIEMRDRLPDFEERQPSDNPQPATERSKRNASPKQEAISALCSLGYKPLDATKMVQAIDGQDKTCEELIRLALQGAVR